MKISQLHLLQRTILDPVAARFCRMLPAVLQSLTFAQNTVTMAELPPCPNCKSTYTYQMDALLVCPECGHEWNPADEQEEIFVVKDCNGNILQNGDSVVTIKNLPVKGSSQSIKAGTKVRNIRLVDSDHNIDCKIDGFGAMALKSEKA